SAEGCSNLGSMYKRGRGGLPVDLAKAAELYGKACKMGYQIGCEQLGELGKQGGDRGTFQCFRLSDQP
ncbi:MAG TPA: SEL1-like repeat protein, partial [Thermoanaerobaculia bacterium]